MPYRSMLVHVDDDDASAARVDFAARLAQAFGAQLVGIYLVRGTDMTPSAAAMMGADIVARRLGAFSEAQHAAEQRFRAAATACGLAAVDWRAPAGSPIDAAIAHGRCTDLFVLGQHDASAAGFGEALISNVLLSSGRPTLVVPRVGAPATLCARVLVAWDAGREAARAIGDALPLLAHAQRVDVLAIDDDDEAEVGDRLAGAWLKAWLRGHDVAADIARQNAGDTGVGEWLLSRAADLGSDLIVMGGYGHARMRELALGGVTRTMLRAMTVPVFMAH